MTSGVETSIENRGDSVPTAATEDKYQKAAYDKFENNNDVKMSKNMMLGGSPAELYYKQLLAANVAVLGKAAKMGFNANFYSNRDEKRSSTPEDEAASVSSNDETEQNENESLNQKSAFVWSSEQGNSGHNVAGLNVSTNKFSSGQGVSASSGAGPGLARWMSVMAEHMNSAATTPHHHDSVHYMWNGVEQCSGSHIKDNEYNWPRQSIMKQGYEAKMNHNADQHNQKGMDDNPMSAGSVATPSPLYNGSGSVQAPRSLSTGSSSTSPPVGTPASTSHMLVIPHPINAAKMTDAHHVVTQNTSGRKYQCKMCPMIFPSKSELQLHSPIHMREVKPYKCTQCSKTFANSSYLSQHTRIHLGIKPYQCEICQRKFTQLSHLQQHVRTHTGQKPYKCKHPNCTKAFSQLSNLQSHSRCHQTDKPFKCNSCYKCFSEELALREHIPKHKESKHLKTHICQFCGKSYTQETYLTKHMQKHSDKMESKRPPIIGIPRVSLDTSQYWPKVSPDTANTLVEALNQQEAACLQNNEVLSSDHLSREMNGNADDYVLRLHHSVPSSTPSGSSPIHPHEPLITVSTSGAIKTPPSSVSAFTPIHQSMGISNHHPPHHNHHHHHHHLTHQHPHIADRGYLPYNTIAFPGSKIAASGNQFSGLGGMSNTMDMSKTSNSGLIALHSIQHYRPPHSFTEHFMQGLKDKTQ